ncbi:MAG: DUF4167 domain-containing protein [Hyphomicrobiales bacterium]
MRSPNENNRTRQGQQNNRRGRNNNNNNNRRNNNNNHNHNGGKPQNMLTRNFDSNGPDVKIRGNAQTIADKYTSLANDAISAGSRIMAENYFQHAEHYKRIVSIAQEQQAEQKAAQQAKVDAQQAAQQERRDQQTAEREQQAAQAAENAEQQAEAPAAEQNENAPVSILDNNETSDQQPDLEQVEAAKAEEKPKRKRVTRPKRKPAPKSETVDALANALSDDTPAEAEKPAEPVDS